MAERINPDKWGNEASIFSPSTRMGEILLRGNMASNNKGGALLAGMIIGGLVGSVTGLLLAPVPANKPGNC
ncbi:hypothetical protein NON20_20475 [Synechocystis sp. B12]|nr:hypothetical protein NON20_20475 [Synechocystis sp. B12]